MASSGSVLEACSRAQKASPPKCSLSRRMLSVAARATSHRVCSAASRCGHHRKETAQEGSSSSNVGWTCGAQVYDCLPHRFI